MKCILCDLSEYDAYRYDAGFPPRSVRYMVIRNVGRGAR